MDAARFDTLTRSFSETRTRRSALQGMLLSGGGLLTLTAAPEAAAKNCNKIKNKKRRRKCRANQATQRCTPERQCGSGCCEADACFASAIDTVTTEPVGFDCCPADKLCRSTKPPYPDQCCYPDETCRPGLTDNPEAETVCCRPCAGEPGGCCLKIKHECINGKCELVSTARLARTRRPG